MKKVLILCSLFALLACPGFSQEQDSDTVILPESLKILEPLINTHWVGKLENPQDGRMLEVTRDFQPIWDGSIIKYAAGMKEINSSSEGYYYWDYENKCVAVFIVGSGGNMRHGKVSIEDGLLTVRGILAFPDRKFEYKNTFEFTADGKMIDRWFHNAFGDWQPGHVIEFSAQGQ